MNSHWLMLLLTLSTTAVADELTQLSDEYRDADPLQSAPRGPRRLHGLLGGAIVNYDKIIGEQERRNGLLPLVILSYAGTAYWAVGGGGVWLASSDDRRLRFGVAMRFRRGWNADTDPELDGLHDRKRTVDAGLSAMWRMSAFNIGAGAYTDVSGNSDGKSATLRISKPIRVSLRWSVTPSLGAEWWSSQLVDYYYGVSSTETSPQRNAYDGVSTTTWRIGLGTGYWFEGGWQLLGGISYSNFGSGISDSPIVNRNDSRVAYVGAWWLF